MSDDLCDRSAVELARRLRAREITARDLVDAHLSRIEARDGTINAFVTVDAEGARTQAAELDAHLAVTGDVAGPLHGLPIGIKDIFRTAGLRTTYGAQSFADHVPTSDALHVRRLRAAGAIVLGKTNTPEFAFSGQTDNRVAGLTRNPIDPDKTVAASSGGSAAAVAAGMAALCDGSDLGGSIRAPASWCGIVGFRPTNGLVPMVPSSEPFDGFHTPGPMTRSVGDAVLMLRAMAGGDPRSSLTAPAGLPRDGLSEGALRPARIAWCMTPGGTDTDRRVRDALSPARAMLEALGCRVADAGPEFEGVAAAHQVFRSLSALSVVNDLAPIEWGAEFDALLQKARRLSVEDIAAARTVRARAWDGLVAFFEDHDLMAWPVTAGLPFEADRPWNDLPDDWRPVELTPMFGLPALSLPFSTTPDGMPVGLQILGPRGADAMVLRHALALETRIEAARGG